MVQLSIRTLSVLWLGMPCIILAHPGHSVNHEIAERNVYFQHNARTLDHCSAKLQDRGVHARSMKRRAVAIQSLQDEIKLKKRSLQVRQASTSTSPSSLGMPSGTPPSGDGSMSPDNSTRQTQNLSTFGSEVFNTSHLSTLQVTPNTTNVESIIYSGNNSCILNPEGEVGPYYVQGEYVRDNISETQAGVPLHLDQQFIDTTTCEPIPSLHADIWHCNATGVYAGVVSTGNGNSEDTSNLNSTFLRGVQKTNSEGVVTWQTIFPGYYQGRTTHIHMVTHMNATELANGTIAADTGTVTHIGQLFFDQTLIDAVNENVSPYTDNQQSVTTNDVDSVFVAETLTDSDPVVNYVLLGDELQDGIFAWITIGVDPNASYEATAAAVLAVDGGHETQNDQGGPGQ